MTATRKLPLVALLALALTGCGKWADDLFCESGGCGFSGAEWARVASLANPGDPEPDLSNEFRDDPFVVGLGQKFFFDPAFSGNATQVDAIRRESPVARAAKGAPIGISCATCHDLERGGADTTSSPGHVSVGAGWTDVNALSVLNSAYRQVVFWNGRADSLWALNVVVAESPQTLNGNRLNTAHVIANRYAFEYARVFGRIDFAAIAALPANGKPGNGNCDTDPAVIATEPFNDVYDCQLDAGQRDLVTRILVNWSKAIAAYEYQLISRNSPFDQFVTEGRDSTRISAAAKRGARLFVGKGACIDCHSGPQLTDEQFHDIGVPQSGITVPRTVDCPANGSVCDCSESTTNQCPPFGAWDGLRRLQGMKFTPARPNNWLRTGKWSGNAGDISRKDYVDRSDKPDFDKLKGAWRTPSLRNVALTAPYMHDGAYASLQDVIWHYNDGAATAGPEQVGVLAPQIKPLLLTESEQEDLVAFLQTLTGEPLPDGLRLPPGLPPPTGAGGMGGSVTGTGGMATGTGGRAGTGGAGGTQATGGSSATGTGGAPPAACMSTKPPGANITDFSEYSLGNPIVFGMPPRLTGRTFSYLVPPAPPNPPPASLMIGPGVAGSPALIVGAPAVPGAPPNNWYVFGLTFDSCVDASAYGGVQFTVSGVSPSCPQMFGLMSKEDVSPTEDPRGTCQMPLCAPALTPINISSGTVGQVWPFLEVDPTSIIGIQWRVPVSCGARLTIDDIAFLPS